MYLFCARHDVRCRVIERCMFSSRKPHPVRLNRGLDKAWLVRSIVALCVWRPVLQLCSKLILPHLATNEVPLFSRERKLTKAMFTIIGSLRRSIFRFGGGFLPRSPSPLDLSPSPLGWHRRTGRKRPACFSLSLFLCETSRRKPSSKRWRGHIHLDSTVKERGTSVFTPTMLPG